METNIAQILTLLEDLAAEVVRLNTRLDEIEEKIDDLRVNGNGF